MKIQELAERALYAAYALTEEQTEIVHWVCTCRNMRDVRIVRAYVRGMKKVAENRERRASAAMC